MIISNVVVKKIHSAIINLAKFERERECVCVSVIYLFLIETL